MESDIVQFSELLRREEKRRSGNVVVQEVETGPAKPTLQWRAHGGRHSRTALPVIILMSLIRAEQEVDSQINIC